MGSRAPARRRGLAFLLGLAAIATAAHGQNYFCFCAIGSQRPLDGEAVVVYSYEIPGLVTSAPDVSGSDVSARDGPGEGVSGALVEIVHAALSRVAQAAAGGSSLSAELVFDVADPPALMQCRFLQAVGFGAIAAGGVFSPLVARDLVAIPLVERDGQVFSLFLNRYHPLAERLSAAVVAAVDVDRILDRHVSP